MSLADLIGDKYATMSQRGITVGQTAGTPTPLFGKDSQFGAVPVGGSATVGGFTARNMPGMAVISGSSSPLGMVDLLRTQGVDPRTGAAVVQAAADANLSNVRAGLLPGETEANIGLTRANTADALARSRLTGTQADLYPEVARSGIGLQGAQASQYRTEAATGADALATLHAMTPEQKVQYMSGAGMPAIPTPRVGIDPRTGLPWGKSQIYGGAP